MKTFLFEFWPTGDQWQRSLIILAEDLPQALGAFRSHYPRARLRTIWQAIPNDQIEGIENAKE